MTLVGRHFFPGGNTPSGFFSFYDYVGGGHNTKTFVLKGGPGSGKSSFMKRIAAELQYEISETEFHHCSADYHSLDGISFPAYGISVLDGTSPHVVDPKLPGVVDEIINLGEYWHTPSLRKHRDNITGITTEISRSFRKAYSFLRVARNYYDDYQSYFVDTGAINIARLNEVAATIQAEHFPQRVFVQGSRERHLFATALTPIGPINFLPSVTANCNRHVVLLGEPGTGAEYVVDLLRRRALCSGLTVESYHCVMRPDVVEHLVIPQLSLAIVTSREAHSYQAPSGGHEVLGAVVESTRLAALRADMAYVDAESKRALAQAIAFLARAKALHDELETYYVPHMDFSQVDARREQVLAEIRGLICEKDGLKSSL
ncbi:MAG: hypothetical protein KGZ92_01390 [Firmicutes bacterium]|nr:hypothetical protein [Dethiobacter sp.]MBS3887940.1 hypothetical protein [Bacillota bacterium]MBS4054220.1 hypothetical protein [Thermaerobacter sp.]